MPRPAAAAPHPNATLALVCAANFMVVLDIAIVNVALPSLARDIGAAPADLQWVVLMYGLTLGGFLLLGGRAADLLGRRRTLVAGLALFTAASLVAGLAGSLGVLVAARAAQGLGAALVVPAALSILASTFAEGPARTKALGIFGAVGGSAATAGVIAGGALTSGPGWEWIFLINVPIGIALVGLVLSRIPELPRAGRRRADVAGALLVTGGLMAVVYAINRSVDFGWTGGRTLAFAIAGVGLLVGFVVVERRAPAPLLPLGILRRRTLSAANLVAALVFASFFATIFQASLFMQQVLRYSAIQTGVAYLAIAATTVVVAGGVAPLVIQRLTTGGALSLAQLCSAAGLLLLSRAPSDAAYWPDIFPGFLLIGIGTGFAAMASEVAAFIGVEPELTGLAGGMVETSREVGGALGIAVVGTAALARVDDLLGAGVAVPEALTAGFQRGSVVAAALALLSAAAAAAVLRPAERAHAARRDEFATAAGSEPAGPAAPAVPVKEGR